VEGITRVAVPLDDCAAVKVTFAVTAATRKVKSMKVAVRRITDRRCALFKPNATRVFMFEKVLYCSFFHRHLSVMMACLHLQCNAQTDKPTDFFKFDGSPCEFERPS
jgi:hypothetical protein